MKCKYCGKRINKSDEICPECGKYVSKKAAAVGYRKRSDSSSPSDSPLGDNIRFFECGNFGDGILASCFMYGIIAVYLLVTSLPKRYEWTPRAEHDEFIVKNVLLGLLLVAVFVIGIVIFSTCKKSFVCVNVHGVYGIRPKFLLIPERFEFFYDDITDFRCRIPASGGLPTVTVTAKGKVYRIYGLNNNDASYLATFIREIMPAKRK